MRLKDEDIKEIAKLIDEVMASIGDKKVALFGSYGWGDGEWMRNWEAEVGSNLLTNGLIVNGGASDIDRLELHTR